RGRPRRALRSRSSTSTLLAESSASRAASSPQVACPLQIARLRPPCTWRRYEYAGPLRFSLLHRTAASRARNHGPMLSIWQLAPVGVSPGPWRPVGDESSPASLSRQPPVPSD